MYVFWGVGGRGGLQSNRSLVVAPCDAVTLTLQLQRPALPWPTPPASTADSRAIGHSSPERPLCYE